MHGIVNLMDVLLCSVCNAISYTTQDDCGSKLLRQKKRKSSVFTNNSVNISIRLFYNSLPLPRMCYVLVSNGWLDSRSNGNIRKSACAGERHVFGIWGIGQFHHPYSRRWPRENAGFLSTACCTRNVYCDNQGKYNA